MRMMSKVIAAGLASVALAGTAVAAEHVHTMNVALPDGGIAKVRYVGDQAPQIRIIPISVRAVPVVPVALVDPTFAAFDRMFAAMNAQTEAMMRQAAMLSQMPAPGAAIDHAALQKLPAGTMSYSYVSTTSANGCTQTVSMTSDGSAQQPKVIRTSAGQCDKAVMQPAVSDARAPAPRVVPATDTRPVADTADQNTI